MVCYPRSYPRRAMNRVKLTDRFVHSIKGKKRRVEVHDAICPGLHLRVTSRSVKTFSLVYRQGAVVRRTLGRYPQLSLADARKSAMALLRDVSLQLPRECSPAASATPTLAELIAAYARLHLEPNLRSWRNVKASLEQPAMATLRTVKITDVDKPQVLEVLDGLVDAGKPHGAANLLKGLRAMFNWAVSRGQLTENPCAKLRSPVRAKPRERMLTDDEIGRILRACPDMPVPFGAMVQMLLLTGARRNEVGQMTWSELSGNLWVIPAARAKNGKANALMLPPAAMAILSELDPGERRGFVFTTTHGLKASSDFSKRKRLLDAASGVSGFRLHDFRRFARTKFSELGVPWEVARRILGHSADALDGTYDRHDYRQQKAAALVKLADHLAELTTNSA